MMLPLCAQLIADQYATSGGRRQEGVKEGEWPFAPTRSVGGGGMSGKEGKAMRHCYEALLRANCFGNPHSNKKKTCQNRV